MPLKINCGLSRKASQDYQSCGLSLNIEAELDATLLEHPAELQDRIARLYQYARTALDRQAAATAPAPPPAAPKTLPPPANGHNARPANGNYPERGNGNGNGRGDRPLSEKQKNAILAIARQNDVDPYASARQTYGCDLTELRAWQASQLIDSLKR